MTKFCNAKTKECSDWVRENGLIEFGGAKMTDFCSHFCIDQRTYYRWLKNAEFANAIKKAKEDFKNSLERDIVMSLAKAAKGGEFEEVKSEYHDVDGKPRIKKQTKTIKNVEPNVGAAIFLLTNLNPDRWQNKQYQKTEIINDELSEPLDKEWKSKIDEELKNEY